MESKVKKYAFFAVVAVIAFLCIRGLVIANNNQIDAEQLYEYKVNKDSVNFIELYKTMSYEALQKYEDYCEEMKDAEEWERTAEKRARNAFKK